MPGSIVGVDFNYEYNGRLSTDVLFKPTVDTPAINTLFRVIPGFKYKQQIPLLDPLQKIVKKYTSCARDFTDGIDITNKTLELEPLEVNMQWCKDDFEGEVGNILAEEWLKSGTEEFDPQGTPIQPIIDELVTDAMRRDNFRIISFGDTADLNDDYNQLDGLWTQLIAEAGSGTSYCVNAPVQDLGTGDLTAGQALETLKTVYEQSAVILKQFPNSQKYIAVTGTIFENLLSSYEQNVNGTENQFTLLQKGPADEDGRPTLSYRGIRVIPIYAWDVALNDPDNPLFGQVKHLVLYTTRINHAVGFDVPADATRINGWYERKDRKYYIEGFYRFGYCKIHCDLQTIAF